MAKKTIDDLGDLKGKRVLVRVDFNVPLDKKTGDDQERPPHPRGDADDQEAPRRRGCGHRHEPPRPAGEGHARGAQEPDDGQGRRDASANCSASR